MTRKILIGIPTGWHLSPIWVQEMMKQLGSQVTDELHLHWAASNTKACAYSELIDKAREIRADGLLLLETNIILELRLQHYLNRTRQFHCSMTPGRFHDNTIGADPLFHEDTSSLPTEDVGEGDRELAPFEVRWGATHLVWMDSHTINSISRRFMWAVKDTKLDHDMPVYCYDGDVWPEHPDPKVSGEDAGNPHRRLAIEQSLYSNIRAAGIGVWADPQLYTTNLRLGGSYRSLRLADVPPR